jgi:hypothetical protein
VFELSPLPGWLKHAATLLYLPTVFRDGEGTRRQTRFASILKAHMANVKKLVEEDWPPPFTFLSKLALNSNNQWAFSCGSFAVRETKKHNNIQANST